LSVLYLWVAPPAGAWIETMVMIVIFLSLFVAPPAGAWIETIISIIIKNIRGVAPPAGAWIETLNTGTPVSGTGCRAPRGRVD